MIETERRPPAGNEGPPVMLDGRVGTDGMDGSPRVASGHSPASASEMLSHALAYARSGWRVLPLHAVESGRCSCGDAACASVAKHPRTRHGVKDATTNEETIRAWWRTWPDANIGLATGDGRWVLDVDGERGLATLRLLEAEHGPIPRNVGSRTGNGMHVFFLGGAGISNRVKFAPGLDTRAADGYVVAPPSLHPGGRRYEWLPDCTDLVEAPPWLIALAKGEAVTSQRRPELSEAGDDLTDREVFDTAMRAVNGEKFDLLTSGRVAYSDDGAVATGTLADGESAVDESGNLVYPSQSEADYALLSLLAFYTASNAQVRRLFRDSPLGKREKAMKNDRYLDLSLSKIRGSEPPRIEVVQGGLNGTATAAPAAEGVVWEDAQAEEAAPEFDRAALYGLAGQYVEWVEPQTEAHPAGILTHFLARFGAAVGRAPHFYVGSTPHHARIWPCMVGQSALARKGLASDLANEPFKSIEDDSLTVTSGLSSGEGLIYAMRGADEAEGARDSKGGIRLNLAAVYHRRRVFIEESEFARVLLNTERQGNTLSETLRNAWDGKPLSYLTKNEPVRVEGAHVVLVAHITREELRRRLNATEMANGFANRFLWTYVKRQKLLPDPPTITNLDAGLLRQLIYKAQMTGTMVRSPAAKELWDSTIYAQVSKEEGGIVAQMTARAAPQVMRLALLYALLDGSNHYIDVPHLNAAMALWTYSESTCRWVWGAMTGDPMADRILLDLRKAPGRELTRSALNDLFGGNRASRQIQVALDLLLQLRLVKRGKRQTKGRASEVWALS